jgi:type I restriction enzyme S subunit
VSGVVKEQGGKSLSRFKPYPAYKDSGVEWLGEIPRHWDVRRLKRLFRVVNGSTPKSDEPAYWDGEIPWATPDDLGKLAARELRSTGRYITREGYESCGTSMVPQGSLVLSTRAPIGHLAIAAVDLCTNQGCRSLTFRKRSDREFFYFELAALRPILESLGDGSTFKELAKQSLEEVAVALPAAPEQRAIAVFLDRETARIDALVGKKERLIELLQEKRTALITRAVTKGLDPNVPMKDSGVEWLGEIPAHWEVMRVRDIAESLQTGPFGSQLHSDEYVVGGTPVINPAHLQDEGIVPDWSSSVDDPTAERLGRHRLSAGDIVFARRGEVGRCALTTWEEEGWLCGTGSLRLRLRADVADPRFFVRMITTGGIRGWLALQSVGSTMQNLNTAIIGRIPVVVPPCSEQVAIADRLDHECERIRQLVGRIDNGIKRLKEFRTALISAAVTGKIDVREPRHSGGSRNPGREPA